jgi:hypothetical protein
VSRFIATLVLAVVVGLAYAGPQDNSLVVGTSQEPVLLGDLLNIVGSQAIASEVELWIYDSLYHINLDANLEPNFVTEVATVDNGRMVITDIGDGESRVEMHLTLRDDILWSDGHPITTADVAFAYEITQSPGVPLRSPDYYSRLSVEVVDALNFRVTLEPAQSSDLVQSPIDLLPEHVMRSAWDDAVRAVSALDPETDAARITEIYRASSPSSAPPRPSTRAARCTPGPSCRCAGPRLGDAARAQPVLLQPPRGPGELRPDRRVPLHHGHQRLAVLDRDRRRRRDLERLDHLRPGALAAGHRARRRPLRHLVRPERHLGAPRGQPVLERAAGRRPAARRRAHPPGDHPRDRPPGDGGRAVRRPAAGVALNVSPFDPNYNPDVRQYDYDPERSRPARELGWRRRRRHPAAHHGRRPQRALRARVRDHGRQRRARAPAAVHRRGPASGRHRRAHQQRAVERRVRPRLHRPRLRRRLDRHVHVRLGLEPGEQPQRRPATSAATPPHQPTTTPARTSPVPVSPSTTRCATAPSPNSTPTPRGPSTRRCRPSSPTS